MTPEQKIILLQTKINHAIGLIEQLIQNNNEKIHHLESHREEMLNRNN
jgi:hypothetical protein